MKNEVSLEKVIDINQWQKIQDHFAETIGVTIRTVDLEGKLLTTLSNSTRLCEEIIRSSAIGIVRCGSCLPSSITDLESNRMWKEGYSCHIGLYNFSIPVTLPDNKTIACILFGPVILGERQRLKRYQEEKIKELGIGLDKFIDGFIEIKVFSFSGVQSVIELLQDVASYIVELGYHRFKLERIIPSLKVSERVHEFFVDKLLNALFDVSFNLTGAECGSITLLDDKAGDLYIKIGRGIKKDIIKHTRLKMGEGIAGLVAQERRFLLVDDKITDERIKNRLQRPEIKSAIVVPIQVRDRLLGVMNLGALHLSDKFSSENINVLRQLVGVVSGTLQDISPDFNLAL